MKPSQRLQQNRERILLLAQQFHLLNLRVFGSALTDKETEKSDLDLLVEPSATTTMLDLCGFKMELEALLGIKVDVLTPRSLPEKFRKQVLQSTKIV